MKWLVVIGVLFIALQGAGQDTLRFSVIDTNHVILNKYGDTQDFIHVFTVRPELQEEIFNQSPQIEIYQTAAFKKLLSKYLIEDTLIYLTCYFETGIKKFDHVANRPFGWRYSEYYHNNGQLWFKIDFASDKIETITYYWPNGKKQKQFGYYYGMVTGKYLEWYESGLRKTEGEYEKKIDANWSVSKKIGKWVHYTEDGKVEKSEDLSN